MAKVKIKGLAELRRRVDSRLKVAINKTIRDKELRMKVGQIVVDDIRSKTIKIAALSTQKTRRYLERYNKTHPDYNRSTINITFTGDLLNDLAKNVKADTNRLALIIEHSDKKHRRYKSKNGSFGRLISHKQLSGLIQDMGSEFEYLQISEKASDLILKEIRKVFSKLIEQTR